MAQGWGDHGFHGSIKKESDGCYGLYVEVPPMTDPVRFATWEQPPGHPTNAGVGRLRLEATISQNLKAYLPINASGELIVTNSAGTVLNGPQAT